MKRPIIFICILFYPFLMWGGDTIPSFSQANELYRKGEFELAIASYEKIVSSGYTAAELYYNLGNAYYRTHRIPMAILNYERARRLNPNDEEINFNLDLAKSRIVDKLNVLPEFPLFTWARDLFHSLSPDQWASASMITFFLTLCFAGCFLFTVRRGIKKAAFWLGVMAVLVSASSFVISQEQKYLVLSHQEAIIMSPTVTIRSSPDETGTELFILHEGTKVRTGEEVGEWLEIRISDGNKGWMKSSDLIRI